MAEGPEGEWLRENLARLAGIYLPGAVPAAGCAGETAFLTALAAAIGTQLADPGGNVPALDVASLALLMSSPPCSGGIPGPAPEPQAAATQSAEQAIQMPDEPITRGEEGIIQGIERLAALPLSERMVITGDIVSGVQMATVSGSPDLSSALGRARMNFVARAVPASDDGALGEGYFFLQMRAAGGPHDSSSVGGPASFSAFNDVATDRSRFNEGTSRGNLYLSKAFYQQEAALGGGRVVGRVGIVNQSDYFDVNAFANNESRQFINSALVNSAAYQTGISAPGFEVDYERDSGSAWLDRIVYRFGYALSRTDRAFTSPLWNAGIELRSRIRGMTGTWRAGGTVGNVAGVGGIHAYHFSADQYVTDDLGVFLRYATNNTGPGARTFGPVRRSYSFGVHRRWRGGPARPAVWGVGFSQAFPFPGTELASEKVLETYYSVLFSENLSITPDFQLIFGSGGRHQNGTQAVGGFRVAFGL